MKSIILTILIFLSVSGYSQEVQNISGLWTDSNSVEFKNCYLIISQNGNNVRVIHYLEYNGVSMIEEGRGKVSGAKIAYKVKVTKAIPGWATKGFHFLELSPDGRTLRGKYKDAKGNTGPIIFKRVN